MFFLGFIFGFAACLACWLRRSVEQRRAFDAVDAENKMLRRRVTIEGALRRVRIHAERVKHILNSGETVSLSPSADELKTLITPQAIGQRFTSHLIRKQMVFAVPSRLRRSRFFRRQYQ